jgi:secretion/DNA translocation related TadE-like protein
MSRGGRARDRGSASVWLLAVGLVLVAAGAGGGTIGAAHVASHRAQAAADLGALAGAARAIEGPAAACARAAQLVAANGARLVDCRLDGLDLTVTVEVTAAALAGIGRAATATARAGPVRADETR